MLQLAEFLSFLQSVFCTISPRPVITNAYYSYPEIPFVYFYDTSPGYSKAEWWSCY